MSKTQPILVLAAVLACAAAVLAASFRLARHEELERIGRDRGALRQFGAQWQDEFHRLERIYEGHLTRLARGTPLNDSLAIVAAADRVVGVRQFSILHRAADRFLDQHFPIGSIAGPALPKPLVGEPRGGWPEQEVSLSEAELLAGQEPSGWIDRPGRPLMFWLRRAPDEWVVLLLDAEHIASAMESTLVPWTAQEFGAVQASGNLDRLFSPGQPLKQEGGDPSAGEPDFLLPVRTHAGTWMLASWDRRVHRETYLAGVLWAGGAAAGAILICGLFVVVHEQRTLRTALERVSFVNAVSHELRAPLTNILLNVEIAQVALDDPESEAARRLGFAQEEAQRLTRLVQNVLTFSGSARTTVPDARTACLPMTVVRALLAQFTPALERRGVRLQVEGGAEQACLLHADGFAQILANLLSNLEKHAGGCAALLSLEYRGDLLLVRVADDGPGIPAGEAERVFQPFVRLNARTGAPASGAGLGLAISRDLARVMGGSLQMVPAASGCTFELRLPAALARAPSLVA